MNEAHKKVSESNNIINISDLLNSKKNLTGIKLVEQIRKHGYVLIDVADNEGHDNLNTKEELKNVDNDCRKNNDHNAMKRKKGSIQDENSKNNDSSSSSAYIKKRKNDNGRKVSEQLAIAAKWRETFATAFEQSLEASL